MILILEGPDGAGKTTLAKQLMDEFKLSYHHEGPPPKRCDASVHYCGVLQSFRFTNVVIDRFALGERVYGPALRNRDGLGEEGWISFQRQAINMRAVQIMCLPPPEECLRNWQYRKGELFKDPVLFWETYARFAYFAEVHRDSMLVYDWTRMSFEELVQLLKGSR